MSKHSKRKQFEVEFPSLIPELREKFPTFNQMIKQVEKELEFWGIPKGTVVINSEGEIQPQIKKKYNQHMQDQGMFEIVCKEANAVRVPDLKELTERAQSDSLKRMDYVWEKIQNLLEMRSELFEKMDVPDDLELWIGNDTQLLVKDERFENLSNSVYQTDEQVFELVYKLLGRSEKKRMELKIRFSSKEKRKMILFDFWRERIQLNEQTLYLLKRYVNTQLTNAYERLFEEYKNMDMRNRAWIWFLENK